MLRQIIGVTVAVAALGLTGCSGGGSTPISSGTTNASSSPTVTSPTASASPSTPSPSRSALAGDFTKEGTQLRIGEVATIPYDYAKKTATLKVAVEKIEKGTEADLAPLQLGDKAKGMTPFYVRVSITGGEKANDMAFSSLSGIHGLLADGSMATPVYVMGSFDRCSDDSFPKDFAEGKTVQSCYVFVASGSAQVTGARWQGSGKAYSDTKTGLTWK